MVHAGKTIYHKKSVGGRRYMKNFEQQKIYEKLKNGRRCMKRNEEMSRFYKNKKWLKIKRCVHFKYNLARQKDIDIANFKSNCTSPYLSKI